MWPPRDCSPCLRGGAEKKGARLRPEKFISKWEAVTLKERSASQEHFIDLCHLLEEKTPAEADPSGDWYCFERGASKLTGGGGWADVWKRGCFGWEYKGKHKDLDVAYIQLQQYAVALESPPLLVVCDMERFRIYTNWTNTVQRIYELALEDLRDHHKRRLLKWVLSEPDQLKPGKTRQTLTEEAALHFASLALRLRQRGHEPHTVAHFVNRLVFSMFAEDIGLLPNAMFTRMLEHAMARPPEFHDMAQELFSKMRIGGRVGFEKVEWFNGGLFDTDDALPLEKADIELVLATARLDWSDIDPSIFGTLFERGLDPDKRSQLGAHYTDRDKVMMLVEPVVIQPLQQEWEGVKRRITAPMEKVHSAKSSGARTKARNTAKALHQGFLERLRNVRVLDPACGSGNFLYLSILGLKDLEHRVNLDAEALGLERQFPSLGPECVKGIEINPYAAELARVTVWIGEIQWMRRNGFPASKNPVLRPLDNIECRDAVLTQDGAEAGWPPAEFIVGNPPFLGDKRMISVLGEDYTTKLRAAYAGRVPGGADLVTFWFERARTELEAGRTVQAGLVATNSIRGGLNRKVLERIRETGVVFEAWSDEPWVLDGAAVRVSLVAFRDKSGVGRAPRLDGAETQEILADLTSATSSAIDLTTASPLKANRASAFNGVTKKGKFDIPGRLARAWLNAPGNPNGRPNTDVLRPWMNGLDVTRRPRDMWIVDFPSDMTESAAAQYHEPFRHVETMVLPVRQEVRNARERSRWWLLGRTADAMRRAIAPLSRFIATPEVAKHRVFVWFPVVGILHSRHHELWALRKGTSLEDRPRYTCTSTFDTFPFPEGLAPNIPAADYSGDPRAQCVAEAARELLRLRGNWLSPPDLVRRVPEIVPGYPDRMEPVDDNATEILKKRTLTNLYNERPAWLRSAHHDLDAAVAAAYDCPAELTDEEILRYLLELNLEQSGAL